MVGRYASRKLPRTLHQRRFLPTPVEPSTTTEISAPFSGAGRCGRSQSAEMPQPLHQAFLEAEAGVAHGQVLAERCVYSLLRHLASSEGRLRRREEDV